MVSSPMVDWLSFGSGPLKFSKISFVDSFTVSIPEKDARPDIFSSFGRQSFLAPKTILRCDVLLKRCLL